jgi:hypothetical protein
MKHDAMDPRSNIPQFYTALLTVLRAALVSQAIIFATPNCAPCHVLAAEVFGLTIHGRKDSYP